MYGAGQYYTRAAQLFEEEPIDNELNAAIVSHKLANVCFNQERMAHAERHYLQGMSLPIVPEC
jgi:hypothetical protein